MKGSILRDKSYRFALRIVTLNRYLNDEKREYVLAKQLLRSGTSIGANVVEGGRAESRSDFVHKLSISLKESFETEYWLGLLNYGGYITTEQAESMIVEVKELQRILIASIKTAKQNR